VVLQVGSNRHFDPSFAEDSRFMQSGAMDKVHILTIISRDLAPPPSSASK